MQTIQILRRGSGTYHGNSNRTAVEQVFRRLPGFLHIVGSHMIGLTMRVPRTDTDKRIVNIKILRRQILHFGNGQNHAIRHSGVKAFEQCTSATGRAFRISGDVNGVVVQSRRVNHAIG